MSFPKYPKYKDSSVEWLGEVPADWIVIKLGRAAFMQEGPGLRNWQFTDEGTRVICVTNITENGIDFTRLEKFISVDEFTSSYTHFTVQSGDILLSSSGNSWGKVAVYEGDEKVMLNTSTIRLNESANSKLARDFLAMVLQSDTVREQLGLAMTGSCQPNFGPTHLSCVIVTVPPIEEQTLIAGFLKRETAKIDELVAEQRRLIELLKEKRQSVISHAVTKGLNPNVPLRDSGIEWLGNVPEHWEVQRIKHVIRSIEQGWSPQCENDLVQSIDQWGVLKVGCVNYGKFSPDENKALPQELQPEPTLSIRRGDLLISRANTVELVGSAAVAEQDYPNLMLCDKLYRLRLDEQRVLPEFLCHFLTCEVAREPIELGASGASSSMKNIAQSVILEMWFASPSINEQRQVSAAICERKNAISDLIAEAERGIELLQERRTALISAAVTGKIDVRGFGQKEHS